MTNITIKTDYLDNDLEITVAMDAPDCAPEFKDFQFEEQTEYHNGMGKYLMALDNEVLETLFDKVDFTHCYCEYKQGEAEFLTENY